MRFIRNKIIAAAFVVVAYGAIFSGIWLQSNQPASPAEPGRPQTSLPGTISPLGPTTSQDIKYIAKQSVVRFPSGDSLENFLRTNNLSPQDLRPVPKLANTYIVNRPEGLLRPAGALVAEQKHYTALLTPNDPFYPQWYTDKISAPAAWDTSTGSSSIIVADIDTGFALNHEDLTGRWATGGWDFVNNDNDPSTGTTNPNGNGVSHGTQTAGLIGAASNNAKGVAAINWGAKILALQALDDNGEGTTTDVASAVRYAVDQGAKVINMSLGTTSSDPILKAELDYASSHDVVVVAAAGNCGNPSDYFLSDCSVVGQMIYPANYPQVLAVGATDINDNRASFSSYGPNLDVVAPGSGSLITTTWSLSNQTSLYSTSVYGTSFSSPIVAGLVALYRGLKPSATATSTISAINSNADMVSGMASQNFTNDYGYGRINASRVLSAAVPEPAPLQTSDEVSLNSGGILRKDDYLLSADNRSALALQRDGNLALYASFKPVWQSGALGATVDRVIMQSDGNLVIYDGSNRPLWATNTAGSPDARLALQADGNLVVYSSANVVLWASNTQNNPDLASDSPTIAPAAGANGRLYPGQSIISTDRRFRLALQPDGNLVLYSPSRALWFSSTNGRATAFLALQSDGNLVLYDRDSQPLWASHTEGFGVSRLIAQTDGNLVLYDQLNVARWNSQTAGAS
ncbi:MAG: S8 family serine peptidase [bacterium]|nr:S8 family serine peptidase [bacterium]